MVREELNATKTRSDRCTLAFGEMTKELGEKDHELVLARESLNETTVTLKRRQSELLSLRRSESHLLKELDTSKEQIDKLESRIQLRETELRELNVRYSDMEMIALQHNRDLAESRNSASELVAKLDAAQSHISILESHSNETKNELKGLNKELEGCTGKYSELLATFDEAQKVIAILQTHSNETGTELLGLQKELEGCTGKYSELVAQFDEAQNEVSILRTYSNETGSAVHSLQKELEGCTRKHSELVTKLDVLQSNISFLQTTSNETHNQLRTLQKELDGCTSRYAEMEILARQQNQSLSETKNENAKLSAELSVTKRLLDESRSSDDFTTRAWRDIQNFFRWLDLKLYQILRWIIDLPRNLLSIMSPQDRQSKLHHFIETCKTYLVVLFETSQTASRYVSSLCDRLRIFHGQVVVSMEWASSTLLSTLVGPAGPNDGGFKRWMYGLVAIVGTNSQVIVIFAEVVAILLCLDFVVSSLIRRGAVSTPIRHKPIIKAVPVVPKVPKQADASLLRKAKLSNK